mgnify:CR=1 FL=1
MDDLIVRDCCPICSSREKIFVNECNIHKNKKLKLFFKNTYNIELLNYLENHNYVYRIFKCKKCTTYYQESFLPESLGKLFYNSGRSPLNSLSKSLEICLINSKNLNKITNYKKKTLSEIRSILNKYNKEVKQLSAMDFGSGWGLFALALKQNNINVKSVEMSEIRAIFQSDILGLDVSRSLEDLKNKKYDIVTSFQVIEHLNYPMLMIRSLYEKLNSKGIMRIEVPNTLGINKEINRNFNSFIGKSSLQPLEHLQAFSNSTFKKIAENLNCRLIFQPIPTKIFYRIKKGKLKSSFNKVESNGRVSFVKE